MEDLIEPLPRTPSRPLRNVMLEYLAWYLSRAVMLATVIVAALFIQEPLEKYVNRVSLARTNEVRLDRESEIVGELERLGKMARKTYNKLSNVLVLIKNDELRAANEGRFLRQLDSAHLECITLEKAFYEKDHSLPDDVELKYMHFIDYCVDTLRRIQNNRYAPATAGVSLIAGPEYALKLIRAIEEQEFIERQRLLGVG